MIRKFVGRKQELGYLNEQYKKGSFQNIIIWGRRRVGKTALALQFMKDKPGTYILLQKLPGQAQELVNRFAEENSLYPKKVDSFSEAFTFIKENISGSYIIALDEFPYLIGAQKGILSEFQAIVDSILQDSQIFLMILGSSISVMENEVLNYKSPMYARRTGQIRLKPFSISELIEYFPERSMEEIIEIYGIFDSIPAYLTFISSSSVLDNVKENILRKESFLFEEVNFLLNQELREPSKYRAILKAVANGKQRVTEIANETGISQNTLTKYIDALLSLHILYRKHPVTEKELSRNTIYEFSDNFFRFYFRFIYPSLTLLEKGSSDTVYKDIRNHLPAYLSRPFEEVCIDYLLKTEKYKKAGPYWKRGTEIDIIALGEKNLIAECKYKAGVSYEKEIEYLKQKKAPVEGEYQIFAKSFKSKKGIDLKGLYSLFAG